MVHNLPLPVATLIVSLVLMSLLSFVVMLLMLQVLRPWLQVRNREG
jgi:antibiotic biosynthesis monooxygenase (ABM) superfamily enzyme